MKNTLIATFKGRWKVLLASLVAQFIIAFLLHMGVQLPEMFRVLAFPSRQVKAQLTSPMLKSADPFTQIELKLKEKANNFFLKKPVSLIPNASAASSFDGARSFIVADFQTGDILYSQNEEDKVPIASLTKIMTAAVALDLASSDEQFEVSKLSARVQPTSIGVVPGERMSLNELLHATLMTSANDAAQAVNDGINHKYKDKVFVKAMNEKAKFLGLHNTHFANTQGFDDPENFSSASDLVVLTHYALENYPEIASIVKKDYQFLLADENHKQFDLYNWNGLLNVYPGVEGMKIGNTNDAKYTTVVVSERNGQKVIAVLLGAPGVLERDLWTADLLDAGFQKLGLPPVGVTEAQLRAKYATWRYFN